MNEGLYASTEIQSRLSSLAGSPAGNLEEESPRQKLFSQSHSFQLFLHDAEQRDTWISTEEAFLSNEVRQS